LTRASAPLSGNDRRAQPGTHQITTRTLESPPDEQESQKKGRIGISIAKDRHGHVGPRGPIAIAHVVPEDDGKQVTIVITPPDGKGEDGEFRPTELMERTSRAIEDAPGPLTKRGLRALVKGNHAWGDRALRLLIEEEYVLAPPGGRQSYSSIKPFRK